MIFKVFTEQKLKHQTVLFSFTVLFEFDRERFCFITHVWIWNLSLRLIFILLKIYVRVCTGPEKPGKSWNFILTLESRRLQTTGPGNSCKSA